MYLVSPYVRTYCSVKEYLMSAHLLFRISCLVAYQPACLPANIFHTIKYHIIYKIDEMRLSNAEKYTQSNMEWKEMSPGNRERGKIEIDGKKEIIAICMTAWTFNENSLLTPRLCDGYAFAHQPKHLYTHKFFHRHQISLAHSLPTMYTLYKIYIVFKYTRTRTHKYKHRTPEIVLFCAIV